MLKNRLASLSLQTKLSTCILLIGIILIALSTSLLFNAMQNYSKAERFSEISRCSESLFATLEALAFERGRTNVVLSSVTPITEANRTFIEVRRKMVDSHLTLALARLHPLDPELSKSLQADYTRFLKLREKADIEANLTLASRDAEFNAEWFKQSTAFIFQIKGTLELLGKKERAMGLFDFHHHFQLDCIEFRLYSGYSASVLTAAISRNDRKPLTSAEYLEFLESRAKTDYIWSCIETDAADFHNADLMNKKDKVYHEYYRVYRPLQNAILLATLDGTIPEGARERLAALSVPAFASIFDLIHVVSGETRNYAAEIKTKATTELRSALFMYSLLLILVAFTLSYFRVMLFSPLKRIVASLKNIVTGQAPADLESDSKRPDEIGLLIQGVQLLQTSMQEERRLRELNENLATTDRLTGLFNRQMLDQKIDQAMAHADRYKEAFSIISFDLDHFKHVNDTWGHPVGDEILKQTAKIVQGLIRNADLLIRFGGEEFLILMPQTAVVGATAAAEKIRTALEEARHPVAGQVTASFGVAERFPNETFSAWYQRADEALYRAKNSGRNRVVSFTADTTPVASIHLAWLPEWESGNPKIDAQHRKLLKSAGDFFDLSLQAQPEQTHLSDLLDRLLDEVTHHFEDEEQILADLGYPDIEEHKIIHKQLLDKAVNFKEEYCCGRLNASFCLSFILDDVVRNHMLQEDQRYFPYTRKANEKLH